jgi:hypothetical protein
MSRIDHRIDPRKFVGQQEYNNHNDRRRRDLRSRPLTPQERKRVGQWRCRIKADTLAGYLTPGAELYLSELLAFSSVRSGGSAYASDAYMAARTNRTSRTIRSYRAQAKACGLIRDEEQPGYPNRVTPMLNGVPVFGHVGVASEPVAEHVHQGEEMPTRSAQVCRGGRKMSSGKGRKISSTESSLNPDFTNIEELPPTPLVDEGGCIDFDFKAEETRSRPSRSEPEDRDRTEEPEQASRPIIEGEILPQ